jgi:hypothetical protein
MTRRDVAVAVVVGVWILAVVVAVAESGDAQSHCAGPVGSNGVPATGV